MSSTPPPAPLTDRLALVTGAGRGIGREIALGLAEAGADLVIAARTDAEVARTCSDVRKRGRKVSPVVVDLSARTGVERLLAALGDQPQPVTLLINNAGGPGPFGRSWQVDPSEWERLLYLNLVAPFQLCRALIPGMLAAGFGRIVNITSSAGRTPLTHAGAYSAGKAALELLTLQLAEELRPLGNIAITAFSPGPSDTAAYALLRAQPRGLVGERNYERFRQMTAAGALSSPAAVARVVVALAAEPSTDRSGCYVDIADAYAQAIVSGSRG